MTSNAATRAHGRVLDTVMGNWEYSTGTGSCRFGASLKAARRPTRSIPNMALNDLGPPIGLRLWLVAPVSHGARSRPVSAWGADMRGSSQQLSIEGPQPSSVQAWFGPSSPALFFSRSLTTSVQQASRIPRLSSSQWFGFLGAFRAEDASEFHAGLVGPAPPNKDVRKLAVVAEM